MYMCYQSTQKKTRRHRFLKRDILQSRSESRQKFNRPGSARGTLSLHAPPCLLVDLGKFVQRSGLLSRFPHLRKRLSLRSWSSSAANYATSKKSRFIRQLLRDRGDSTAWLALWSVRVLGTTSVIFGAGSYHLPNPAVHSSLERRSRLSTSGDSEWERGVAGKENLPRYIYR